MNRDGSTSTSLLQRALAHEPDAWARLVTLYSPLVRHWCRQAAIAHQDVPDISQEVFAALSSSLGSFRADRPGPTFRAWMRGVARIKLLEHIRHRGEPAIGGTSARNRIEQVAAPLDDVELSESPDDLASLCQRALGLVKHEFEERTWRAFWRVTVEGHSTADVAVEMGITSSAIRQAKSRVLRRLKEELGELTA
jgi:RNA polymerase sigma-70 factor, ECF subfamily